MRKYLSIFFLSILFLFFLGSLSKAHAIAINTCEVKVDPSFGFYSNTTFTISGKASFDPKVDGQWRPAILTGGGDWKKVLNEGGFITINNDGTFSTTWKTSSQGDFRIEIYAQNSGFVCASNIFTASAAPEETGPTITPAPPNSGSNTSAGSNPQPCAKLSPDGKKCLEINTAIGGISTEPKEFVTRIFGVILGLAGGIALILIMISGYRIMASQGNPEALQAGREQLISAVVGLLFIIFSFVILQVIGVEILKIPGFG